MKKILGVTLACFRAIVILTATWLLIEKIYYALTGQYIIYYKIMLQAAENVEQSLYIINQVYNVNQDRLAHYYSNCFIPAMKHASFAGVSIDTLLLLHAEKKTLSTYALYVIEVVSMLIIVFLH